MKPSLSKAFLMAAGFSLVAASQSFSQGTTVTIEPAKDNSIFSEAVESNGQGSYLFVGRTNEPSIRRALLQFDVAGAVPAGAIIESATLTLLMNKTIVGGQNIGAYRLSRDWGEGTSNAAAHEGKGAPATAGDATWLNVIHPSVPWTTAGGDFAVSPSASKVVNQNGSYTWEGAGMVSDVQQMLDNPANNFGWILIGPENTTSAKRFASRESTLPTDKPPTLTITYSMAAPTWAGYPINPDGQSVDTGSWIGWIDIEKQPWIYSYGLNKYIYVQEQFVGPGGGWIWAGK
ncbi:MAG TPA: DNRLRE domain-containing protein [Oceanipulchritudo sp.]|nr:DNRLRE domain-containing protein [Oceanipulchritudo sp.]